MSEDPPNLGEREREVMQAVWLHGPITAERVRENLSKPLKQSTVRTVLRRLEEKGYATHTVQGRTFLFSAAEQRSAVAAKAVKRIVDWLCNGSVEEVLAGMVDQKTLDPMQLQALLEKIAKPREPS